MQPKLAAQRQPAVGQKRPASSGSCHGCAQTDTSGTWPKLLTTLCCAAFEATGHGTLVKPKLQKLSPTGAASESWQALLSGTCPLSSSLTCMLCRADPGRGPEPAGRCAALRHLSWRPAAAAPGHQPAWQSAGLHALQVYRPRTRLTSRPLSLCCSCSCCIQSYLAWLSGYLMHATAPCCTRPCTLASVHLAAGTEQSSLPVLPHKDTA